ncbi:MAG: hypothetical protein QXH35_08010 [Nitrososphaerota archaeon]
MPVLVYGDLDGVKGIFLKATLLRKVQNAKTVDYWVKNPTGYPLQIHLRIDSQRNLSKVQPVKKEELALTIPIFKQRADRWSLVVFGEKVGNGVTYPLKHFLNILTEFEVRNKRIVLEKPDHEKIKEILFQMGMLQKRISKKEVKLDRYSIDVAWRKIPTGDPYIVFEVHISGNLEEALAKLKHANDKWNSQPLVLVTTREQVEKAAKIIDGAFHEFREMFRVIDWEDLKRTYETKAEYKKLESMLGIF